MYKADRTRRRVVVHGVFTSMSTMAYLGIDVAKRKVDVALLRPDGKVRSKAVLNTTAGAAELRAWVARYHDGPVHACLEATGTYGLALAEALADAGYVVSLVNPARIAAYARSRLTRSKTDPVDARLIAEFCAKETPPRWVPPSPEIRALQALVRRLDALDQMRTQELNRLAAEPADAAVRASIQHVVDLLEDEMQTLRARIHDHFDAHPGLRAQRDLLTSIPGIGQATAAVLLAEFGGLTQFRQAAACAAYAGLVPQHRESGTSVRHKPVLSKLGVPLLRKALFYPALVALRFNPIIVAFGERLRQKGKHKMVVIAAAMHKLVHLAYGVLKTGKAFDPKYRLVP
jgi:transposase